MQSLSLIEERSSLKAKLAALRAEIPGVQSANALAERGTFPFSLVPAGIARGSLVEVSGELGSGKTETALRFLSENKDVRAAWVEERMSAYPVAFPQQGVALERVLFVEAGREILWASQQLLRSTLFGALVITAASRDALTEINIRRLQLAAEKSLCTVFILTREPIVRGAWAISLHLEIKRTQNRTQVWTRETRANAK